MVSVLCKFVNNESRNCVYLSTMEGMLKGWRHAQSEKSPFYFCDLLQRSSITEASWANKSQVLRRSLEKITPYH